MKIISMGNKRHLQTILILSLILSVNSVLPNYIVAQKKTVGKLTPREIAKQTLPSTVLLVMSNSITKKAKSGSGFFVAEDIVATNFHVIKETTEGYAKIYGQNKTYEILGTVGVDEKNDLALLKIKGIKGKPLKLNTNDSIAIGDEVFAVGNPEGLEGTFSQGIVSSIRKTEKTNLLQITASISAGSSGGAILNNKGEVIGVAVGAIESGQNLNFAIPVSLLRILLSSSKSIVLLDNRESLNSKSKVTKNTYNQFKASDTLNGNLFNNVKSIKEYTSPVEMELGKIKFGKPTEILMTEYDLDGNIKSRSFTRSALYAKDSYLDDYVPGVKPDYDNSATTFRHEYNYDYVNKTVTIKYYAGGGNEYKGLTIIRYANNEIIEQINYDSNKKLVSKIVLLNDKSKKSVEIEFSDDGQECKRKETVSYINEKNEKVFDVKFKGNGCYVGSNYVEVVTQTINKIEIQKTFLDKANNPYIVITKILDNQTKLTNQATISQKEKDSFMHYQKFKYEYQFDSKGNWIKRSAYELIRFPDRKYAMSEPRTVVSGLGLSESLPLPVLTC